MRRRVATLALMVGALWSARAAQAQEEDGKKACRGETYGTAVTWFRDAAQAQEKARAEKKLVLVMHLSGELDDAEKT